jgi:cbb3-type cytochrome oxidase cytochrome c subunit
MKHPQMNMVFFVLGMTALCRSQTEKALTLVETTAVIIGLQQYFRSGCVFFLYSNVRKDYGEHTVRYSKYSVSSQKLL